MEMFWPGYHIYILRNQRNDLRRKILEILHLNLIQILNEPTLGYGLEISARLSKQHSTFPKQQLVVYWEINSYDCFRI